MKILTLVENCVQKRNLLAEHGLSFYIETRNKKILFDTGQSDILIHNAKQLGADLRDIDTIVISHGHYDHTGGLAWLLDINKKASIYIKKEALSPKYGRLIFAEGRNLDLSEIEKRVEYVSSPLEIDKDLFIMPDINILNPADTSFDGEDKFEDELFLAVKGPEGVSVISSCSHNGITNIAGTACSFFGLPLDLILGGFHTRAASLLKMETISEVLRSLSPKSIGVCHCTGWNNYFILRTELPDCNVFYNQTGNCIVINS